MKINIETLKNNKHVQKLMKIASSNFVGKIVLGFLIWVATLLPTWMYIGVRFLIDPLGFWQEFAIFMTFAIILGLPQFILIVLGIGLLLALIFEDW